MIYKWETERERLIRFMRIPPIKKLEWLQQMNEFVFKFSSKKQRALRKKLRESR